MEIDQLKQMFEGIRDEKRMYANTATRIGDAFLALLSYVGSSSSSASRNYLRKDQEDTTSFLVTFEAGINIGEDIYNIDAAGNAILRSLKSGPFDPGKGEKGTFDLYVADDRSYLDIDNINIRESLKVTYLQIGNGLLKWDEENKAFYVEQLDGTPASFYATKGLSALGFNSLSDTGGGSFDLLQDWDKYVDETAKSMALSAYLGKDLLDRITSLEKGQKGHKITISGSGNVVVNVEESSDGGTLTFTKGNIDISGYATKTELEAVSKKTDSVTQRVDEFLGGSDTDGIINKWKELEAFLDGQQQGTTLSSLLDKKVDKTIQVKAGEGLSGGGALSGNVTLSLATVGTAGTYTKVTVDKYGRVTGHATLSASDIPTLEISKINGLQEELDKKLNISDFGNKFATEMANWFKKDTEGNVFVANSKGFYSESFVSAMGKSSGGSSSGGSSSGGGSYDRLDNWADYSADRATWVLSAKLGYDLNTRVSSLESGSAINFETSGTGNALTGFSKSGNTVTFTKGTFLTEHQKLYTLTMQRNGEGVGSYVPTADKIININACTAINVPQGFTAGALSSVGVIALSFASGYSLPTTAKQQQWDTAYSFVESIAGSDANGVIDKWNEIISFLDGIGDSSTLEGLLNDINSNVTAVSSRVTKLEGYFVNGVAKEAAKTTGTLSINGKNFNGSASVNVGVIGVSYGGTGKSSVASGSMLYASAANTYAELATTEFGRNLLKANSGSVVSGLYAEAAYKLQNKRTIWGQAFDGTANISGAMYNVSAIVNETSNPYNHRLELGRTGVNQWDFYEYGGVFNFYRCQYSNGENKVILFKINNGSVGILTDTPTHTLHVNGTGYFSNTLSVASQIRIGNGTITWDSTKGCFHFSHGLYSDSYISAMGKSSGGSSSGGSSSGGGSYDRLDNWADYSADRATWVLSAKLGYDLNTRVSSLESGSAINFETSGTGNALTGFSKSGNTVTFTKGTFLTEHQKLYTLTMQRNGEGVGSYVPTADKIININACTAINVPQGFTAGALSSVGVIALSFASGYSLPTTAKQQQWDTAYSFVESIAGSDANGVIDKWNEIISFLDGIGDSSTLEGLLNDINSNVTAVSSRVTKLEGYFVNGVAKEAAKTTGTLSINGKNFNGSASVNVGVIGVSYGGTGKSSVASGSMLYASAANTYAELATTEFGRNLLKANSGSVVSGLYAEAAYKLQNKRTIWGQAFDGTANISGAMYNVSAIVNETSNPYNHRLELGRTGVNQWDFYEYGGVFNFYRCQYSNGENKVILFKINNGSVGILTDTPTHTLHVNGTGYFSNTLSVASQIRIGNGTITWDSTKGCFHFSHGLYSDSYISAMGLNAAGGSGGSYERLDSWSDYTEDKATWVLSALLGSNLNTRVSALEAGGATSVVTSGTGNVVTAVTKSGNVITATKGITALTSHQNIYALTLQGNGSTIGTFNPKTGNSTINITAANIGAAASSHTHNYLPLTGGTITGELCFNPTDASDSAPKIYSSVAEKVTSLNFAVGDDNNERFVFRINYWDNTNDKDRERFIINWDGVTSKAAITAPSFNGNLNGNASTASQLNVSVLTSQSLADYKTSGHLYYAAGGNTVSDKPSGVDAFGMFTMQTAGGWRGQILMASNTATGLYWRTAGTFSGGWRKILDSSNYGEYAYSKTDADGRFVNLSGDTMTGVLKVPELRFTNGTAIWFDQYGNVTFGSTSSSNWWYIGSSSNSPSIAVNFGTGNVGIGKTASTTYKLEVNGDVHANSFTGSLNGNASTASKWQAARTVTMNGFADCSFSIDGSSNVSFDYKPYNFYLSVGNKNNYPWHRIAKVGPILYATQDKEVTLLLSQGYDGGKWGIVRMTLRTNSAGIVSTAHVEWLNRRGFNRDDVKVGLYNIFGETYADVFLRIDAAWKGLTGLVLTQGGRGTLGRTWALVNSSEASNTTTTDKLTSTECWASIEVAAEELHKQAYTNIIEADDAGGVGILYDHGKLTAISGTTMPNEGLRLYRVYNNGYPAAYGNLMSVRGENSGAGELLLEWKGSTELGHIYYRSKRDNTSSGWSSWGTLAFLTDNVASATKLQTARSINGTSFDGTENITTFKWGSSRNIYIRDASQTHTGEAVSVDGSSNEYLLLPKDVAFDQITINTKLISNGQTDFNKQWLKNVGGIWFGSADSSSVFASFDGDGTQTGLQSKAGTSIYFGWRGGTRAMTIDSAGNVVIGNTSTVNSAYKLDVKGDVRTQGDIVPYSNGQYNIGSSGARWNTLFTQSIEIYGFTPYIDFHYNNSSADYTSRIVEVVSGCLAINGTLAVLKSGNVGIGTTLPTEKLYVSGNIAATGAVTALVLSSSSDIRLKDIRKNVCLSVEEIAKAPAVEFAWKKTGDLAVGSIAQYWQPILPQAIHKRDNYLSMQYDVIALLASIANARRILSIEKKIKELEEEVKRLKIS